MAYIFVTLILTFDLEVKVKLTKRHISPLILNLELRNALWTHRKPWITKKLANLILTFDPRSKVKSQNGLYLT